MSTHPKNLRRLGRRASRGQSLVETALVLPIVVLVVVLGIDLGRIFFTSIDLRNAAHEASMAGGSKPDIDCNNTGEYVDLRRIVDRQMDREGASNGAVCGAIGPDTERVYIVTSTCERIDPGPACAPWAPQYPPDSQLRYVVTIQYRFQPVLPIVGLLTGNGLGSPMTITAENRTPVLAGYTGG